MPKVPVLSAAIILAAAGIASAGTPVVDVIYSRAPLSATSTVPGAVDAGGNPVTVKFLSMLHFWLSPDGTRWMLMGSSDPTGTTDAYLILGSGLTGTVVLQESQTFPGAVGSEVVDFFSSSVAYPFNSANDWAFSLRARGGTTGIANKIFRVPAAGVGSGVLRFKQGDLYTGMMDIPANPSGDETIGNSTLSIHLLDDGRIGWRDANPANMSSFRYPPIAYDAIKYRQRIVDSVTTLDGSGTILLTDLNGHIQRSPDGTREAYEADIDTDGTGTSTTPDAVVVVVDGQVRIQLGQPIPGSSITPTAVNQVFVAANGDWYTRGAVSTGTPAVVTQAWAVRNGTVIAKTGDAIVNGGGDTWGTSFQTINGGSGGDWVISGRTSNADTTRDDVLTLNGEVILREGDPVSIDLDNNGSPDTAFIGRANVTLPAFAANNAAGIAPDGTVYTVVNLRTTAAGGADLTPTATVPYALIRITFPPAFCPADFNESGGVSVQDIFDFLAAYFSGDPDADFNNSGPPPTVQDIFDFLAAYFTPCP